MAGDWIKMRSNLWDDPRIGRIVDETNSKEATIIGALYWLWASADQHTETGVMPGLSLKGIDRKTGVKGFAQALCDIGWLEDRPEGVIITNFEEHNGASAKKRTQTAKRVAKHKSGNAKVTQPALADSEKGNAASVSSALPREREEKEKDLNQLSGAGSVTTPNADTSPPPAIRPIGDWSPRHETVELLTSSLHAVPQKFILEQVAEFITYWRDRNLPAASWDSKFIQRCSGEWKKHGHTWTANPGEHHAIGNGK